MIRTPPVRTQQLAVTDTATPLADARHRVAHIDYLNGSVEVTIGDVSRTLQRVGDSVTVVARLHHTYVRALDPSGATVSIAYF